jgi:hypothetical protein
MNNAPIFDRNKPKLSTFTVPQKPQPMRDTQQPKPAANAQQQQPKSEQPKPQPNHSQKLTCS